MRRRREFHHCFFRESHAPTHDQPAAGGNLLTHHLAGGGNMPAQKADCFAGALLDFGELSRAAAPLLGGLSFASLAETRHYRFRKPRFETRPYNKFAVRLADHPQGGGKAVKSSITGSYKAAACSGASISPPDAVWRTIASISTSEFFGNAATCTVALAGRFCEKNEAYTSFISANSDRSVR